MAMKQLSIKGRDAAQNWLTEADKLNEEAAQLIKETGMLLNQIGASSEGSLVDDLVKWGGQILDSVEKISAGMKGIAETINGILNMVTNITEKAAQLLKGAKSLFG